ncbi:MAG TPA: efflux RND transporter periplasmic adaptor subunit [Methylomirabilota bacterium]|nr:efflux RND transporter periplasmic adaptor subunit [Methylomirabilota bacterium]
MRVGRWLSGTLIVGAVALVVFAERHPGTWTQVSHFFSAEAKTVPDYELAKVEVGPIADEVRATGTLRPRLTALVTSPVSGRVKEILVDFNVPVTAGQVVARLDDDDATARLNLALADLDVGKVTAVGEQAQIERARNDAENLHQTALAAQADADRAQITLADAERELKRKQGLATTGDTPKELRDQAETAAATARSSVDGANARAAAAQAAYTASLSALRAAESASDAADADIRRREAAVEQARVDLAQTEIRAPIDGTIIARDIEVGQAVTVGPQTPPLFVVAQDLRQMLVYANVDEADVGGIADGQAVTFTVDAHPGEAFSGQIADIHVSPEVVQNVVTYTAVIAAANPDLKLLPGMTANVRITLQNADAALKVPNAALRFQPDGAPAKPAGTAARVWVLSAKGQPQPVDVRTGITDGIFTELLGEDVHAGERVIVGIVRSDDRRVRMNTPSS